jgi:hypothetical protein
VFYFFVKNVGKLRLTTGSTEEMGNVPDLHEGGHDSNFDQDEHEDGNCNIRRNVGRTT